MSILVKKGATPILTVGNFLKFKHTRKCGMMDHYIHSKLDARLIPGIIFLIQGIIFVKSLTIYVKNGTTPILTAGNFLKFEFT